MARINSMSWAVNDQITATRLNDLNEDLDDLYTFGSDRGRVVTAISAAANKVDIGEFAFRVGQTHGTYAGGTDISLTNNATNYIMVDDTGTIVIDTSDWISADGRLAIAVTSGGVITSIALHRADVVGGDLGDTTPLVTATTMSGNATLGSSEDQFQYFDPNGSNRDVTLSTGGGLGEGKRFYIHNTGLNGNLVVKQGAGTIATVMPGRTLLVIYDGTDWQLSVRPIDPRFGDGSDGLVNVTSGTTTLDCASTSLVIKQYTSFNISVGATWDFSNVPNEGLSLVIFVQGNLTIAGTLDGAGDGTTGGAGVTTGNVSGNSTSNRQTGLPGTEPVIGVRIGTTARAGRGGLSYTNSTGTPANAAGQAGSSGANPYQDGAATPTITTASLNWTISSGGTTGTTTTLSATGGGLGPTAAMIRLLAMTSRWLPLAPGTGGGSGGACVIHGNSGYSSGNSVATSLAGGRGGASVLFIVGGTISITGTVNLSGANAAGSSTATLATSSGSDRGLAAAAGGSSGGTAGDFVALGKGAITDSGTYTQTGGTGSVGAKAEVGTGGGGGSTGYKNDGLTGATGFHICANIAQ